MRWRRWWCITIIPALGREGEAGGLGAWGQPLLHRKLEASLICTVKTCLRVQVKWIEASPKKTQPAKKYRRDRQHLQPSEKCKSKISWGFLSSLSEWLSKKTVGLEEQERLQDTEDTPLWAAGGNVKMDRPFISIKVEIQSFLKKTKN